VQVSNRVWRSSKAVVRQGNLLGGGGGGGEGEGGWGEGEASCRGGAWAGRMGRDIVGPIDEPGRGCPAFMHLLHRSWDQHCALRARPGYLIVL
jgi:hypothetical protein